MFCPNCGSEVKDDDLFCGECGAKIERTEVPESEPVKKEAAPQQQQDLVIKQRRSSQQKLQFWLY